MTTHARARIDCFVLMSVWLLIFCREAYAYLDPGTGAFLLQLLLGGLVGVAFGIKIFWRRIVPFFSHLFSKRHAGEKEEQ